MTIQWKSFKTMTTKATHFLLLGLAFITLTSSRGAGVLLSILVMLLQLINFIGFGLIGIIYSAISLKKKSAIKTGKNLIIIFSVISLISLILLVMLKSDSGYIVVTTLIEVIIIGTSFVILSKARKILKNNDPKELKDYNEMESI